VLLRSVLDRHQSRATPFASHGEALHESEREKDDGRHDANLLERWQEPDEEGRPTHEEKRRNEHCLATDPIAEMAKDDTADRTCDESDDEAREGDLPDGSPPHHLRAIEVSRYHSHNRGMPGALM
jgi:hypothetical protein